MKAIFTSGSVILILFSLFFLPACTAEKPNTPQTVAQAFWSATLKGDTETAKQFLTPQSRASFKVILRNPKDFVELGEQSVTTTRAEILTQLTRHQDKQPTKTTLRTILINQNGQWLVDFEQTRDSMLGSELQAVIDELSNTMRATIDKGIQVMGESMKDELEQFERSLQDTLEDLNKEIEKQQQQNSQPAKPSYSQTPKTSTL